LNKKMPNRKVSNDSLKLVPATLEAPGVAEVPS
jgi:hypothetical protein